VSKMVRNGLSKKVFFVLVFSIAFLVGRIVGPVQADDTIDDGRINGLPWVNSFGAVAVYCVDQRGVPARSITGGGIKVLSESGQELLFAREALIIPALIEADKTGSAVFVHGKFPYKLFALPNGFYQLDSAPDREGKTFVGRWFGCQLIRPPANLPSSTSSAPICVFEGGVGSSVCTDAIDNDCDGFIDSNDSGCIP
jgi:hypothetical protein